MISMRDAADRLERLCFEIDSASNEDIESVLLPLFEFQKEDLKKSVDDRISYIRYLQSQIMLAEKMKKEWAERLQKMENLLQRIRDNTVSVIKANPNLKFAGSNEEIRVCKNAIPRLIHPLTVHEKRFEEIILDSSVTGLENYLEQKIVYVLNKDAIKKDIQSGKKIDLVRLEHGEHVRIGARK